MTRRERLIKRIVARPPEALYRDVRALLEEFGFEFVSQRGSHVTFHRPGTRRITIPLKGGRYVVRPYIDEIIVLLELEDSSS